MPSNIQTTYNNDSIEDQENNNPMLSPTTNWKHSAAKAKHNLDKILSDIGELNIDGLDKYVDLPLSPLSLLSSSRVTTNNKNQKLDASSCGLNSPTAKKKKVKPFSPSTNASNHEDGDELQQIPTVELLQQSDDIIKRKEENDNDIIIVVDDREDTTQVDDAEKAASAAAALMKERIASEIENRRKEEEERARLEEEQRLNEEERRHKAEKQEKRKKAEAEQARLIKESIEKRRKEEEEEAERKARVEQQRLDEEKAALELEKRRKLEALKLNEQEEEKKKQNNNEQTERQAVQDLVNTILQLNTKQVVKEGKSAYYTILGVDRDASLNNIKKGYRKRALKLHPDKDKYSTPNAEEAFRVVSQAYNVLSDPESRRKYDDYQQKQRSGGGSSRRSSDVKSPTSSTTMSEQTKKKVPSQYNIIPSGTRVTISGTHVTTFNGLQGCILEYDRNTSLYTVQMDGRNGPVITAPSTSIFQNVIVCLRANKAPELACAGVFLVTLSSYYKDNCGGCYQARYSVDGGGGRTKEAYLLAEQFIIPNGTVVRVGNEHGLIIDWREESTGYTQVDPSYYEVQMSETEVVRVKMGSVRL